MMYTNYPKYYMAYTTELNIKDVGVHEIEIHKNVQDQNLPSKMSSTGFLQSLTFD